MRLLRDFQGLEVRLTDERLEHILEHSEMRGSDAAIGVTLAYPERVVESHFDSDIGCTIDFIGTPSSGRNTCA